MKSNLKGTIWKFFHNKDVYLILLKVDYDSATFFDLNDSKFTVVVADEPFDAFRIEDISWLTRVCLLWKNTDLLNQKNL